MKELSSNEVSLSQTISLEDFKHYNAEVNNLFDDILVRLKTIISQVDEE